MRFTIRSMMIAVVLVAILLANPGGWGAIVALLSLPALILTGCRRLVIRGRRWSAAAGFCTLTALVHALYAACCIAPNIYLFIPLYLGWFLVVFPMVTGLGTAWAMLSYREGTVPRPPPSAVLLSIFILASLPMVTVMSCWPLHAAFFAAKPTMRRLADQVAAGRPVVLPQQVGMFRVVKAAFDPASGSVALMIDPNPNGPAGFVRVAPGTPREKQGALIVGSDLDIDLGGGWSYRADD